MPARITPGTVKILTQDGEVQVNITLELNINLNTEGLLVAAQVTPTQSKENTIKDADWLIPEFASSQKINFGKRE